MPLPTVLLAEVSSSQAVAIIKQCVQKPNSVPAPAVLSAMLDLEAAKLPVSGTGPTPTPTPRVHMVPKQLCSCSYVCEVSQHEMGGAGSPLKQQEHDMTAILQC